MASIGSVFLGDVQRHRVFSSTPPSSPPGSVIYSGTSSSPPSTEQPKDDDDDEDDIEGEEQPGTNMNPATGASKDDNAKPLKAVTIDPVLSLELRLRWLEALVFGVPEVRPTSTGRVGGSLRNTKRVVSGAENKTTPLKHGETLVRLAKDLQSRLDAIVEGNEGLKRFMSHFDQHAHLLTSASALSGVLADTRQSSGASAPDYANMAPEEFEALLQEMEPDIRAADRDMREIEILESKGVTGAGKLAEYEKLKPRLETVIRAHQENLELAALLEKRIATLVRNHATQVDALSELFVAWDETLTEAENKVTTLEREKAERLRLGLEQDTY